MNSEISCNLSQFPETEEDQSALLDAAKVHNSHNINAFFFFYVHGLGMGPSTKWI